MNLNRSKTDLLLTILREINKQHIALDGLNRISMIYTARPDAVTGDPCHVREYVYYGLTLVVKGRAEGLGTWDSAFDGNGQEILTDDLFQTLTDDLGTELVGA